MNQRIRLRPLRETDLAKMGEWKNDPTIRDRAVGYFLPSTDADERDWLARQSTQKQNSKIVFAIALGETDRCIGFIHLSDIHWIHRTCTLGMIIGDPADQGQGYGGEALKAIVTYAFQTLNLNKISLHVIANNHLALNLYRRTGFIEEGHLKQQYFIAGAYHDALILSLWRPVSTEVKP